MTKKIYLIAIIITSVCMWLYIPRLFTYAQDKAEQRELAQKIMDLELELSDLQAEWETLDSDKQDFIGQIELFQWYIKDIQGTQDELHNRAVEIRNELNKLSWHNSAWDITNCYEYTWDLYNDCLDAYIQVGLSQRRQPQ